MLAVVRQWVASLPEGAVSISEEDYEYEFVLTVQPTNPRSSPLVLRIGKYDGQFDATVGRAIQFDDLLANAQTLLPILQAVQQGQVEETVLAVRGRVARAYGSIGVGEQTWRSRSTNPSLLLLALIAGARSENTQYEPFE